MPSRQVVTCARGGSRISPFKAAAAPGRRRSGRLTRLMERAPHGTTGVEVMSAIRSAERRRATSPAGACPPGLVLAATRARAAARTLVGPGTRAGLPAATLPGQLVRLERWKTSDQHGLLQFGWPAHQVRGNQHFAKAVPPRRRASAIGIMLLLSNHFSGSFGPLGPAGPSIGTRRDHASNLALRQWKRELFRTYF